MVFFPKVRTFTVHDSPATISLTDEECVRILACKDWRTNNIEALSFDSISCRI